MELGSMNSGSAPRELRTTRGLRSISERVQFSLSLERVGDVIREMLREELWCRSESQGGFVHIGWDYYMYIGVPHRCPKAELLAEGLGLYPERFSSPYKKCLED
jgi:hypothetical protein